MFSMLSPEENEQLIDAVSEMLSSAALIMYSQSSSTAEHNHAPLPGTDGMIVVCIHEYRAQNGRSVRLFVNPRTPRTLTMSITVGDGEVIHRAPEVNFEEIHDQATVNTLEHILSLPDAKDPQS